MAQSVVEGFRQVVARMEGSGQFKLVHEFYPPLPMADIEFLEEHVRELSGEEGFRIWRPLAEVYAEANGFVVQWQYLGPREREMTRNGSVQLQMLDQIYLPSEQQGNPVEKLYEGLPVFDDIGPDNHVALKFARGREEPELYYFTSDTGSHHRMSIGLPQYWDLLLEARAMHPWQELFIADPAFTLDPAQRERFLTGLATLFPEADASKFQR